MTEGQILFAKDEYELYGVLKNQVSIHDFVEGQIICLRFLRSSDESFVLDKTFISNDVDKIWKFQGDLSYQGFYCVLDSLEDIEEVTYGCSDFVAVMKITETHSWTDLFEFNGQDARYEKYLVEQAATSLKDLKKILAG
ncbi:hypothetical protein [Bdellovibrio bacteriovorus]|uniref:hypothetical protein n=1 Tax=Bdellovibrio TaxID=958 RepID=UPI0035A91196